MSVTADFDWQCTMIIVTSALVNTCDLMFYSTEVTLTLLAFSGAARRSKMRKMKKNVEKPKESKGK